MVTAMTDKAALAQFIIMPVSRDMISHLAKKASGVIRCEQSSRQQNYGHLPPTPPRTPPQNSSSDFQDVRKQPPLPTLEQFITSLVERSHVQVPTLMSALVYLDRLKRKLPPAAKGVRCTVHRIFLASLILAAKYLNDSSPKNKHWARYSIVRGFDGFGFSLTEVNLMEKQLLMLLDWDLRITEEDLYRHLEPFLTPIKVQYQKEQEQKLAAQEQARLEYEEYSAIAAAKRELHQQRPRHPYSPSIASISSSLHLASPAASGSPYANDIAGIQPVTPISGRSSRASERPEYMGHKARAPSNQSNNEYLYPTPLMTAPSSSQVPELEHPGSGASSEDNSPLLPPPPFALRNQIPITPPQIDANVKLASSSMKRLRSAGILSRFFTEKQQSRNVTENPTARSRLQYA